MIGRRNWFIRLGYTCDYRCILLKIRLFVVNILMRVHLKCTDIRDTNIQMLHPRKYREGTLIERLPLELQEKLVQYVCPYTMKVMHDETGVDIAIYFPGATIWITIARGIKEKLLEFIESVRLQEVERWKDNLPQSTALEYHTKSQKTKILRYNKGWLVITAKDGGGSHVIVCPLLLDTLAMAASYL